ncbi:SRR1-domain-containing protein [Syncephalastrum racemosum]|uniref:SRR1-domain-containing protein n=1 Tax=Syncephalastrum racemosum TaxID=13706 RepID=A0A1X2GZT8_SYNRA|nr:SRR1-domain-containing protein [Syncephalastrum racemosum]
MGDDDGFTKVERKFRYMTVDPTKKQRKKKHAFVDPDDYTLADLEELLNQRRQVLFDSRFYTDLEKLNQQHLPSFGCKEIICYGIGSMQHSKNAQFQFILALELADLLNLKGKMSIFDPVMTALDKQLCEKYQVHVIEEDEKGKRTVNQPTLFYMPHCSRNLYSNTISANWKPTSLTNLYIIGNRFDMYVGSQLERDLLRECPYLIPANTIVQTVSFPKKFDDDKVFNDLAIQWFPSDVVPQGENDPFWSSVTPQADPEAPIVS